jgi:uncharacterized protein (TIGR03067 family)
MNQYVFTICGLSVLTGKDRNHRISLVIAVIVSGLFALCLAGCQTPRSLALQTQPKALRTLHIYDGPVRSTGELMHVKVVSPIKVSFVDDIPVKASGGEILALLPGAHNLIAGAPMKSGRGDTFATHFASVLSENKEISLSGRAGELFYLNGEVDNSISEVKINNVPLALPKIYRAKLNAVTQESEVGSYFTGVSEAVNVPLTRAFLGRPLNARDYEALQGRWAVVGLNLDGKDYTVEEFRKQAKTNRGDATMLDIKLEIKGVRMRLTGSKVRGETILVEMDSQRSPKVLSALSVGNGEDHTTAIFDIQGDILKYCFAAGATTPPRSFTSSSEMGRLSLVLRREAADNDPKGGVK